MIATLTQSLIDALAQTGGWILLLPLVCAFAGAALQRATGFGFGFLAGAGALSVFDPVIAVIYIGGADMLVSGIGSIQLRRDMDRPVVRLLLAWMMAGVIIGVLVIGTTPSWLLKTLAVAVSIWAIWEGAKAIRRRRQKRGQEVLGRESSGLDNHARTMVAPEIPRPKPKVLGAALPGLLGGMLGTCLGIPGPPIVGYLSALGISPFAIRSTLLTLFAVNSLIRVSLFPLLFSMASFSWTAFALICAGTGLGVLLGGYLGRIIPPNWFAYINLATLFGSGSILSVALIGQFMAH